MFKLNSFILVTWPCHKLKITSIDISNIYDICYDIRKMYCKVKYWIFWTAGLKTNLIVTQVLRWHFFFIEMSIWAT